MADFATVQRAPPRLLLAISLPKIKLQNLPSSPTGHQDQTQNAVARRCLSPQFNIAQASLLHTSVFSPIMPSSSRKLMMMVWKYYRYGLLMQGMRERNWWGGEALWQGGMSAIRPSKLTKKSWRIWEGYNNHRLHCCHCRRFFLFSPSSNYHIFKYI
jgi:hypothetical protein